MLKEPIHQEDMIIYVPNSTPAPKCMKQNLTELKG
jgi:hypothetical protein